MLLKRNSIKTFLERDGVVSNRSIHLNSPLLSISVRPLRRALSASFDVSSANSCNASFEIGAKIAATFSKKYCNEISCERHLCTKGNDIASSDVGVLSFSSET